MNRRIQIGILQATQGRAGGWLPVLFSGIIVMSCTRGGTVQEDGPQRDGAVASRTESFSEEGGEVKEQRSGEWTPGLEECERETLFAIAEDTLRWCVSRSGKPFSFDPYTVTPKLQQDMATFVTLKIDGALRGCIGSLAPVAPLYRSVHDNAINAAMRDTRFPRPVSESELPTLDVHISILSPIADIGSLEEFKTGEHGIIIEKRGARAVFLPEVAIEQNWSKEETLSHLSRKAGLSADSWREGARFKVFSSVVLSK